MAEEDSCRQSCVTEQENRTSRTSIHEGSDWGKQSSTSHQTGEGIRDNEREPTADEEADDTREKVGRKVSET
jgi:hypothetical protein